MPWNSSLHDEALINEQMSTAKKKKQNPQNSQSAQGGRCVGILSATDKDCGAPSQALATSVNVN